MQKLTKLITMLGLSLIAFTLTVVFVLKPPAESKVKPTNSNRSLLVQFRDENLYSKLNFIVADHGTVWFYVPSALAFERKLGISTLGTSSQNLILQNSQNQLNDSIGIDIDDVWQVDKVAFASLVESADGVEVGNPKLQTLNGFEAYSYVFESSANPKVTLQRFREVWPQIVASFGSRNLINEFTAIGSSSRSSIEQSEFVAFLENMNKRRKSLVFKELKLTDEFTLSFKARQRLIDAGIRETLAP